MVEVGNRIDIGNVGKVERGKSQTVGLLDVGGQHGQAIDVVEDARMIEVRVTRPPHHGYAHLLVGGEHDASTGTIA